MWSSKRRNNNRSSYTLASIHGGRRRRRKGKKSLLYTRYRSDPDPWQGSPPKTPPSSDDENEENQYESAHHSYSHRDRDQYHRRQYHQNQQHQQQQQQQQHQYHVNDRSAYNVERNNSERKKRKIMADITNDEYAVNSNFSISSGLTRSSSETVAPAPIIVNTHSNTTNNNNECRRRLNAVKRKISKYVKMENANVLQSHQFTRKQTKLNVKKTAPVPLPFINNNNNNNDENVNILNVNNKKLKNKPKQIKTKQKQKSKQKQKQTAPVPMPSFIANNSKSSKPKTSNKASKLQFYGKLKSKSKVQANKDEITAKVPTIVNINIEEHEMKSSSEEISFVQSDTADNNPSNTSMIIPTYQDSDNLEYSSSNQNLADNFFDIQTPPNLVKVNAVNEVNDKDEEEEEEELVDFAAIPEAYYIGFDNNMDALLTGHNSNENDLGSDVLINTDHNNNNNHHQNVLDLDIIVIEKELNAINIDSNNAKDDKINTNETTTSSNTTSYGTPNSNATNDEIVIYSSISAENSSNDQYGACYNNSISDFTNSDSSLTAAPTPVFKNTENTEIEMEFEENKENQNSNLPEMNQDDHEDHDQDSYFTDTKFTALADQILDEKHINQYQHQQHVQIQQPQNNVNSMNYHHQPLHFEYQMSSYQEEKVYHHSHQYQMQGNNIWSEQPYQYQYAQQLDSKTLGGLLMTGLPPINKGLFH